MIRRVLGSCRVSTFRCLSMSSLPASEVIKVDQPHSGVYHVKLNRPEKRNSLTQEVWRDLRLIFDHLNDVPQCRAVVLSGEGQSFCAGIDLKVGLKAVHDLSSDQSKDTSRKAFQLHKFIAFYQDGFTALEKCRKPVIAAIHSHCVGAGISLVSCCDVRYAVSNTVFSIKEVDVGLAADVGILQRIQKVAGNESWARELSFTARNFSGSEALEKGFVSRTFDDKESCLTAALALAVEIASKSPVAVQGTKLAMNYARDHSVDESLAWMRIWNQTHLLSEDMRKIGMAMMTKGKPEFEDV